MLETPSERESGNGSLELNAERREMKSEPPEGLTEVYGDTEMGNSQSTDGMDQRSMVYPIGCKYRKYEINWSSYATPFVILWKKKSWSLPAIPGPSVSTLSGHQETMSLGNQDTGGE